MKKPIRYNLVGWVLLLLSGPAGARPAPVAPLPFVANQGQWSHSGRFVATVPGGWLFLEPGGFTYNLQPARQSEPAAALAGQAPAEAGAGHAYRVRLLGANPTPVLAGEDRQLTYHNYFLGNDPAHWASHVPLFAGVRYQQVYAGVDVRWHQAAAAGQLEYDFEVAPGADARVIRLRYEGLSAPLALTAAGHLRLRTSVGEVREQAPVAWQTTPQGARRAVPCRFGLGGAEGNEVSFLLGAGYDPRQPLTIDPTLVFATYSGTLGGMSANATAPDAQGNLYTSGYTLGPQFPVTVGAYKTRYTFDNMAIAKLAADGKTELFATYLGSDKVSSNKGEYPLELKVNPAGDLLVLGLTSSADYPTTAGAFDRTINGDQDYVLTCLSSTGDRLVASTFLGGSGQEGGSLSSIPASLEIDPATGDVLAAGTTASSNFPTLNAWQAVPGGSAEGVLTRLSPDLASLRWSTYLGGAANDEIHCVRVAPNGEVYVSGRTLSLNFPVGVGGLLPKAPGSGGFSHDGFVVRLSAAGQRLGGTYLGTTAADVARFLDFDQAGNVLVGGATEGAYPVTTGAYSAVVPGATSVFVHGLSPALSATVFSTRLSIIGSSILNACNLLTAFGRDDCGRLYMCAYGATIASPGAPCTADALSKEARTFYTAVLSDNASSLLYGSFVGDRNTSAQPDQTVIHLHFAAAGKITRQGTLYQLACAIGKQFGTTPGAYSPTNRSFNNDGLAFRFDLTPGSTIPGARASIAAVPPGCAPYATQFTAVGASPRLLYRWDFGDGSPADLTPTPSHTYAVAGTYLVKLLVRQPAGSAGCGLPEDNATATVVVVAPLPAPAAVVAPVAPGCAPYRVQFANQSTGTALRYRWSFGDGTTDTTAAPAHLYAAAGTYPATLTVTQPNGACGVPSSSTQQAVVVYTVPPALIAQINALPPACAGASVQFGVQHNGAQLFSWDFGDGTPPDARAAPTHAYAAPGTYLVRLRLTRPATNNCDQGQAVATLPVLVQAARAARQVLDSLDCRQQLTLDPALPGTTATAWATGETTRTLLITAPGRYRALVTVANEACPVAVEFEIKPGQLRALANIITPNGDGRNDVFRLPASYGAPELRIYNRWGRLVYQAAAYGNDWSAPGLPADLYYYHLRRADCNLLLKGWVEVVR